MTCTNCGINLPPGAAVCPRCGTPTPYNITGGSGGSPQYDKTVAATPYNNSPAPSTAYGAPPYGSPQPANPYEIPPNPYGVPQSIPNPYGTPAVPSPGNYNAPPPPPQQYIPPVPQQYTPPPPKKRGRTGLIIGIIVLVAVIILVSIIGVVYSNGQHQLAVQATATAQTNATSTAQAQIKATSIAATAIATTYPFSNKVLLNDPLSDNSKGMKWDVSTNQSGGSCQFTAQAYHAKVTQAGTYNTCYANQSHFSDFTFQVDMTITSGDRGGLLFRADSVNNKLYYFRLDQNGSYSLFLYIDNTGTNASTLDHGTATGFNTGLNQKNTVGVVARGNSIGLYVNNQLINSITNNTYTTGLIGLTAESNTASTEVVYSNLMVWGL